MPGTATLLANVLGQVVPALDEVRTALEAAIGDKQWTVWRCVRTWSGARRGLGSSSVVETQITPTPKVGWGDGSGRLRFDALPTGLDETGQIVLTEISLTYTEAELYGQTENGAVEVYYKLVDAQGGLMAPRYFDVHRPPVPDRESGIGWIMTLNARTDAP